MGIQRREWNWGVEWVGYMSFFGAQSVDSRVSRDLGLATWIQLAAR